MSQGPVRLTKGPEHSGVAATAATAREAVENVIGRLT